MATRPIATPYRRKGFHAMKGHEVKDTPDVVTSTFSIYSYLGLVLLNSSAGHFTYNVIKKLKSVTSFRALAISILMPTSL